MVEAERHQIDEREATYLEFIGAIAEMSQIGNKKLEEEMDHRFLQ